MSKKILWQARWNRFVILFKQFLSRWEVVLACTILALWGFGIIFAPWFAAYNPFDIDIKKSPTTL